MLYEVITQNETRTEIFNKNCKNFTGKITELFRSAGTSEKVAAILRLGAWKITERFRRNSGGIFKNNEDLFYSKINYIYQILSMKLIYIFKKVTETTFPWHRVLR